MAAALLLWTGIGHARLINVPGDLPTIQAGIDTAGAGDTVEVAPGTYAENLDFKGKAITVTSSNGPSVTIIDGGGLAPVVLFSSGEGVTSVLAGFTITNGLALPDQFPVGGGGISIRDSSPTIEDNIIVGNYASGGGGGGIAIRSGAPTIQSNTITHNGQAYGWEGGGGGGLFLMGADGARIVDNNISDNSWTGGDGGGIYMSGGGKPLIAGNLISGNLASGVIDETGQPAATGGGISMIDSSGPVLVNNLILGNTADIGGGLALLLPILTPSPPLTNNTIAGNYSTRNMGSAVSVRGFDEGSIELYNNILIGAAGQYAVFCSPGSIPPVFESNDVFGVGAFAYQGSCASERTMYGNISADPQFVDPANNDYRLAPSSPAIDAGRNSAPNIPSTDYYGSPRIVVGKAGDYQIVDMGAAEFQPAVPISPATPTPTPTPIPNVIMVPVQQPSVQAGIDAASDGQVVRVAPGTYFETIDFKGKAIRVLSSNGPQSTIINGHGIGSVVTFASGETSSSVLSGFTITGGSPFTAPYTGAGIFVQNSSPTISSNIVTQNYICGSGGGIGVIGGSPTILRNVISNNVQYPYCDGGSGAGIFLGWQANAQVLSNTISNNSMGGPEWGGHGGGISIFYSDPLVMNNVISGNSVTGVIGCVGFGVPCDPLDDRISLGGGVLSLFSDPALIQNLIIGNTADVGGGAFIGSDLEEGSPPVGQNPIVINNTISGNQATTHVGAGICTGGFGTTAQFVNNIITAADRHNPFYCASSVPNRRFHPVFDHNDVFAYRGNKLYGGNCLYTRHSHDLARDPRFVDPVSGDYHLTPRSPLIDAGRNSAPDLPGTDFYGQRRLVAGKIHRKPTVDIGISEYQP